MTSPGEPEGLDDFFCAYIEAALWSTNDESTPEGGVPFDQNYGPGDIDVDTWEKMRADCAEFLRENAEHGVPGNCTRGTGQYTVFEQAGHDFWLTRCGHGCGFNDGDWKKPGATALYEAAKKFGEVNLYLGDDGKIYS